MGNMQISVAKASDGTFELEANFLGQFVHGADPAFGYALEIRNLQRHFAGKQQCCNRALEFVSQSLLRFLPDQEVAGQQAKCPGAGRAAEEFSDSAH